MRTHSLYQCLWCTPGTFLWVILLCWSESTNLYALANLSVVPESAQVLNGRRASFHCYGEVDQALYWWYGREQIESGEGYMLEEYVGDYKVLTLKIASVSKEYEGQYCCSSDLSTCSSGRNATLVVIVPSSHFLAPSVQLFGIPPTSAVFVECSIQPGDPLPEIVWYLEGTGFLNLNDDISAKYSANYSGLLIDNFSSEDFGNYTCEYQNSLSGSFSAQIKVQMLEPGNTIVGPAAVQEGSNVTLQCLHRTDLQVYRVEWMIPDGNTSTGRSLFSNNALDGIYTCTLYSSGNHSSIVLEHKLLVYVLPDPFEYTATILVFRGTTVTISPLLKNDPHPPLLYTWSKDGHSISPEDAKYPTENIGGYTSIEIISVSDGDEGTYTCIGLNDFGQTIQKFRVDVYEEGVSVKGLQEANLSFRVTLNTSWTGMTCNSLKLDEARDGLAFQISKYISGELCHCQINVSIVDLVCGEEAVLRLAMNGAGAGGIAKYLKDSTKDIVLDRSLPIVLVPCSTDLCSPPVTGLPDSNTDGTAGIYVSVGAVVFILFILATVLVILIFMVLVKQRKKRTKHFEQTMHGMCRDEESHVMQNVSIKSGDCKDSSLLDNDNELEESAFTSS